MSLRLGNRFEDRIEQEARVSQAERDEIRETRLEPPSIPPALSAVNLERGRSGVHKCSSTYFIC